MPRYIVKIEGRYFEWSTIVDAPVSYGMSREELGAHILASYGRQALRDLPERLQRVDRNGTSALDGTTLDDLIAFNRAGENEAHADVAEILRRFDPE